MSHMPYAMDLSSFSLTRFVQVLTTVDLLPSRRVLADHIGDVAARLEADGVSDLAALRRLLTNKSGYEELALKLDVDVDYVTVLAREVNSYKTKPMPLAKLNFASVGELAKLAGEGIRSTKDLYERCAAKDDRAALRTKLGIGADRLEVGLQLANLVRINGVGPAFAQFLVELGVRGPEDIVAVDAEEIVDRYNASIADRPNQPKLRTEDIEYCKRFCKGLQADVEW
jgi:hypothetical protein